MSDLKLKNLVLLPLNEDHFLLLHAWLNSVHVAEFWGSRPSIEEVRAKYSKKIKSGLQQAFIVFEKETPFGYVQYYRAFSVGSGWWPKEPETTVCLDQFIGAPDFLGKGYGTLMVREFSDWLLTQSENRRVIVDPKPNNLIAIRCYLSAGFNKVGLIETPDGPAQLMAKERLGDSAI